MITQSEVRRSSSDEHLTKQDFQREISHYATKEDTAELKALIAQTETRLVKWMFVVMVGSAGLATAFVTLAEKIT